MINNYLSKSELNLSKKFIENGYVIVKTNEINSLKYLKDKILKSSASFLKVKKSDLGNNFLNLTHKKINLNNLNDFRLKIINEMNQDKDFKFHYFNLAKKILYTLVGNELAMQRKVNLSIQFPNDDSSLLPVHSDVWSGDSPFEVVVWVPLVDCFSTKTMYLLPPKKNEVLSKKFKNIKDKNSESLFQLIKEDVKWLKVNYGEVLVFNQALPHGNRINEEKETRWSTNCRFKGLFTPYGDKKFGEFFEPITSRAATNIGTAYKLPKL